MNGNSTSPYPLLEGEGGESIRTANLIGSVSRNAGGMFESVRRLVQSLAGTGMEVKVFGLADEFTVDDLAAWAPVAVRTFRRGRPERFGFSRQLARELGDFAPDITHTHGIWMYLSVATLSDSRRNRRPYLISAHGMLDPWAVRNSRWRKLAAYLLYERRHLRGARCLRALCEPEARAMRSLGLKNPIAIIPNGVDLPPLRGYGETSPPSLSPNGIRQGGVEVLSNEFRDSCGLKICDTVPMRSRDASHAWESALRIFASGDGRRNNASEIVAKMIDSGVMPRKVLLYLGRIHPKKGLLNLLKAWARVGTGGHGRSGNEEWLLAIAGWDEGGHEIELRDACGELGLAVIDAASLSAVPFASAQVLFPGPQFGEAKGAWLAASDAFILPSYSEGLPMAALEAWAQGKPVVMTSRCNLAEGFGAGAALRIEPGVEEIVHGLEELFEMSDGERGAMGQKGRELAAARFAWPRIAAETRELYQWVLGGGPKPRCVAEF